VRDYELLFVVVPSVEQEPLNAFVQRIGDLISGSGGSVEKGVVLGRRRLAYPIKNYTDGIYVLFWFQAEGPVLAALNRELRLAEPVLRHIIVFRDERMKAADAARAAQAAQAEAAAAEAAQAAAEAEAAAQAEAAAEEVAEFEGAEAPPAEAVEATEVTAAEEQAVVSEVGASVTEEPAAEGVASEVAEPEATLELATEPTPEPEETTPEPEQAR